MILKQPASFSGVVTIGGVSYPQDSAGHVTIPDDQVTNNLYGFGFVRVTDDSIDEEIEAEVFKELKKISTEEPDKKTFFEKVNFFKDEITKDASE